MLNNRVMRCIENHYPRREHDPIYSPKIPIFRHQTKYLSSSLPPEPPTAVHNCHQEVQVTGMNAQIIAWPVVYLLHLGHIHWPEHYYAWFWLHNRFSTLCARKVDAALHCTAIKEHMARFVPVCDIFYTPCFFRRFAVPTPNCWCYECVLMDIEMCIGKLSVVKLVPGCRL